MPRGSSYIVHNVIGVARQHSRHSPTTPRQKIIQMQGRSSKVTSVYVHRTRALSTLHHTYIHIYLIIPGEKVCSQDLGNKIYTRIEKKKFIFGEPHLDPRCSSKVNKSAHRSRYSGIRSNICPNDN